MLYFKQMATMRQKKAFQKVLENRGNLGRAMIEAGYTCSTSRNPKNLTNSKSWHELVNQYLPDSKLMDIHSKLLDKIDDTGQVHSDVIRGLDLAYKIKGKYKIKLTVKSQSGNDINLDRLWNQVRNSFNKA